LNTRFGHPLMRGRSMDSDPLCSLGRALFSGPHGEMLLLLRYGSGRDQGDCDYLAVYDSSPPSPCVVLGGLDLWATDKDTLFSYISLLDPVVTEPLLTGSLVIGSSSLYDESLAALQHVSPSDRSLSHLLRRSFRAFLRAWDLCAYQDEAPNNVRRDFWSSLSFSLSYWSFSSQYGSCWKRVLTLAEVVQQMPPKARNLWGHIAKSKRDAAPIDTDALNTWSRTIMRNPAGRLEQAERNC
jgi:hypothetical protein